MIECCDVCANIWWLCYGFRTSVVHGNLLMALDLFVFFKVHSHVDIYNFTDNTWGGRFDMPKEMAHSHLGMVTDGRYIYVVTGQYGPQCRGPTAHTFVLDTETKQWQSMPPLPVPRYELIMWL